MDDMLLVIKLAISMVGVVIIVGALCLGMVPSSKRQSKRHKTGEVWSVIVLTLVGFAVILLPWVISWE